MSMDNNEKGRKEELKWLKKFLFAGLQNRNDGFDSELIHYFSAEDFQVLLDRAEFFGIGITGIEPWLEQQCYDVATAEEYDASPSDSGWYRSAFANFRRLNGALLYAATYDLSRYLSADQLPPVS